MEKYILFKNRDQDFAIDVSKVERIIEFQDPKKIPESLEYLIGVIKYEKSILPVIDLNIRLYGSKIENTKDTKIIVVAWKNRQMGLLVDNIVGINNFEEEYYEESNIDTNISKRYIDGFIKLEDSIVIVLDIDGILNEEKEQELLESMNQDKIEEGLEGQEEYAY